MNAFLTQWLVRHNNNRIFFSILRLIISRFAVRFLVVSLYYIYTGSVTTYIYTFDTKQVIITVCAQFEKLHIKINVYSLVFALYIRYWRGVSNLYIPLYKVPLSIHRWAPFWRSNQFDIIIKKILYYLKKTTELRLKFGNKVIKTIQTTNKTIKYIDNNYVNNIFDRKFIINYVFS